MRPTLAAAYIVWTAWAISWFIAAFWAGKTVARPLAAREWRYRVFTFPGFTLLLAYLAGVRANPLAWIFTPAWRLPVSIEWLLVMTIAGGAAFAWWARVHLGTLWSASLTRKAGHHVVDTGPYAIVRHPIYTGLIVAGMAMFAIRATPLCGFGLLLFVTGYRIKAGEEERFLSAELGAQDYAAYRARVPMLIPFATR
jgi:protein-S-isoprenylcysteine O-methyltransferase Ste14